MNTNLNSVTRLLCISAAVLCVSHPASAATETTNSVRTEEITVYANMSLRKLRLETNRAQEAMFNVFNELNGDERLDIKCEYVQRWQSKIREYQCGPVYLKTAQEQEVNLFLGSIGSDDGGNVGAAAGGAGVTQMDHFNAMLEEKMKSVFQDHQEFRQAMDHYNVVREAYETRLGGR